MEHDISLKIKFILNKSNRFFHRQSKQVFPWKYILVKE